MSSFSPNLKSVPAMFSSCGVAARVEEGDKDKALNLLFNVLHIRRSYADLADSVEFG